jgi:hypothetical protein
MSSRSVDARAGQCERLQSKRSNSAWRLDKCSDVRRTRRIVIGQHDWAVIGRAPRGVAVTGQCAVGLVLTLTLESESTMPSIPYSLFCQSVEGMEEFPVR